MNSGADYRVQVKELLERKDSENSKILRLMFYLESPYDVDTNRWCRFAVLLVCWSVRCEVSYREGENQTSESGFMRAFWKREADRLGEIENITENLTRIYSEPPIPVYEIAREKGLEVYVTDFEEVADVFSGFCDFKNDNIFLNQADTPKKQYLTAAHELGHWILHKDIYTANPEKYMFMPRRKLADTEDPMEKEADHFAACLLMPRFLVKEFYSNSLVAELADMFNVSRTLMEKRLRSIS